MSKFLANVIKLGSATLVGQILGVILTPVLSRLYSPADFGNSQLFFSIVSLIAVISCFSYYYAILLPKKHEEAALIVVLCFFLIGITAIITTVFFFIFSDSLEKVLNTQGLSNYILLLPIGIICSSGAYVLNYWLTRKEEYNTVAKANIYSSITSKGVSIGSGIISPSPAGLIVGSIANDATICLVCFKKTIADYHFFQNISFKKIKQIALKYKQFPLYGLTSDLTGSATVMAIPFMIAFFFSPDIVGYYALAHLVIKAPFKFIGNSIATVFFQKASYEKNLTGSFKNTVKIVHSRLISIGLFGCLMIMIIGPELFAFIFGNKWYTAGIYAQILTPWFFVAFISVPLSSIFKVLEKQDVGMWFNIFLFISEMVVLYLGGISGNPIIAMILLSLNGIIFWSWMNMYLLKISNVSVKETLNEILKYLLFGLILCSPLIIAKYFSVQSNLLIVVGIIVSIIYYSIILYRDSLLKAGLLDFIKKIIG
jgi:lipopolysaccharide exporter